MNDIQTLGFLIAGAYVGLGTLLWLLLHHAHIDVDFEDDDEE